MKRQRTIAVRVWAHCQYQVAFSCCSMDFFSLEITSLAVFILYAHLLYFSSDISSTTENVQQVTESVHVQDSEPDGLSMRTGGSLVTGHLHGIDEASEYCPDNVECRRLGGSCIQCNFNEQCTYGKQYNATCWAKKGIVCKVSLFISMKKSNYKKNKKIKKIKTTFFGFLTTFPAYNCFHVGNCIQFHY